MTDNEYVKEDIQDMEHAQDVPDVHDTEDVLDMEDVLVVQDQQQMENTQDQQDISQMQEAPRTEPERLAEDVSHTSEIAVEEAPAVAGNAGHVSTETANPAHTQATTADPAPMQATTADPAQMQATTADPAQMPGFYHPQQAMPPYWPPYGNWAPPQEQQHPGHFYPYGVPPPYQTQLVQRAVPPSAEPTSPRPPTPKPPIMQPDEEQLADMEKRFRAKTADDFPWDWLGQRDYDWNASWILPLWLFALFRVGMTCYAGWALYRFVLALTDDSWDADWYKLLDPTLTVRFLPVLLALFFVTVAFAGVTLLTILKVVTNVSAYRALSDFRASRTVVGWWRTVILFEVYNQYDAALTHSLFPVMLWLIPRPMTDVWLRPAVWPTSTLPFMIMLDYWLTNRCKFSSVTTRRWAFIRLAVIATLAIIQMQILRWPLRELLALGNIHNFWVEAAPVVLIAFGFAAVAVWGLDGTRRVIGVKADYLRMSPFVTLDARTDNEWRQELVEGYGKKWQALKDAQDEKIRAWMARMKGFGTTNTSATATDAATGEVVTETNIVEESTADTPVEAETVTAD